MEVVAVEAVAPERARQLCVLLGGFVTVLLD